MRLNGGAVQLWRVRHMLDDLEGMRRPSLAYRTHNPVFMLRDTHRKKAGIA
jgi:hypothetical protein